MITVFFPSLMTYLLDNKVALITGASGEIGYATAIEFAKEGVSGLVLQYNRSKARVRAVASAVEIYGCTTKILKADVSKSKEAKRLVNETLSGYKKLDAVVCLAGYPFVSKDWFGKFEHLTPEQLKRPLEVDLLGSIYVVQAAIPEMKRRRKGKIVLVGSTPAITGDVVGISYSTAKGGLLALNRSLAQYLGPYNIHVNALALGAIDIKATLNHLTAKEKRDLAKESALGRFGKPEEVAQKIVFLCSNRSDFLTGQTLIVDGGYAMR